MADTPSPHTPDALRSAVRSLMPRARADLTELVAMRSIADPRQAPPEECLRTAQWVRDAFTQAGIESVALIETSDGSPAVVGHRPGPAGAPTVLLYCHYDIQPAGDEHLWHSDPFTLTERDGRWFGRGSADCKGNIAVHLTALRALDAVLPAGEPAVGLRIVAEGSEEMGTGGLEDLVRARPDLFAADLIVVADAGNVEVGVPTVTTTLRGIANVVVRVDSLAGEVHSGMFGGAAPDALTALVALLGTLHDSAGDTTVDGLEREQSWSGADYPAERFRADAGVLDGVGLTGSGTVAEQVWARPALTVLGIDCPPVVGSAAAIQPRAAARLNLRVPPGMDPVAAQDALVAHLESRAPWGVRMTVEREAVGAPFAARTDGPGFRLLAGALAEAFGAPMVTSGQGGSIPLCNALAELFPDAEIALLGVEEPRCRIHAPNESVDPGEIERLALAEALLLARLADR